MPKMILRGAFIRFVDVRYDVKSKMVYTKINMQATLSDTVRETMGWGEPAAGFGSGASLDGNLHATHFILTPNSRQQRNEEIQVAAKQAGEFVFQRVQDGETTSPAINFQVISTDPNAPALLSAYLTTMGKSVGQLRLNYEQQAELPLNGEPAEGEEERLISEEQADETADESGAQTLAQMPRRNRRKLEPAVQ